MNEARLDVELLAHPTDPDRLLDGTVRHLCARGTLAGAAKECGYAVCRGADAKTKRYPVKNGKVVIACAAETFGWRIAGGLGCHGCRSSTLQGYQTYPLAQKVARTTEHSLGQVGGTLVEGCHAGVKSPKPLSFL